MLARLGMIIYWLGTALAATWLFFAGYQTIYDVGFRAPLFSTSGYMRPDLVFVLIAAGIWAISATIRYIFAGR